MKIFWSVSRPIMGQSQWWWWWAPATMIMVMYRSEARFWLIIMINSEVSKGWIENWNQLWSSSLMQAKISTLWSQNSSKFCGLHCYPMIGWLKTYVPYAALYPMGNNRRCGHKFWTDQISMPSTPRPTPSMVAYRSHLSSAHQAIFSIGVLISSICRVVEATFGAS